MLPNGTTVATFDVFGTFWVQHVNEPQNLHVLCGDFSICKFSMKSKTNKTDQET